MSLQSLRFSLLTFPPLPLCRSLSLSVFLTPLGAEFKRGIYSWVPAGVTHRKQNICKLVDVLFSVIVMARKPSIDVLFMVFDKARYQV